MIPWPYLINDSYSLQQSGTHARNRSFPPSIYQYFTFSLLQPSPPNTGIGPTKRKLKIQILRVYAEGKECIDPLGTSSLFINYSLAYGVFLYISLKVPSILFSEGTSKNSRAEFLYLLTSCLGCCRGF